MDQKRAIKLLTDSNALLTGHFMLASGNHSERYIQCALLLSRPDLAVEFLQDIADHFKGDSIDIVAAPAVGGIIVSYEVGRFLGKRTIFLERENGIMSLRRGFSIKEGEKVLIVEDVITTGSSVLEVRDAVLGKGGHVIAFASLVNRSAGRFKPGLPYYFCIDMDIPIYNPDDCPLCQKGTPVVKPGSKGLV
ncbi:MAG: orotate phosphoribosyltransferase [Spirochaetes bacterium]|nr:orotate phosphoribosyltransferase [Spirochaetota bacterium]